MNTSEPAGPAPASTADPAAPVDRHNLADLVVSAQRLAFAAAEVAPSLEWLVIHGFPALGPADLLRAGAEPPDGSLLSAILELATACTVAARAADCAARTLRSMAAAVERSLPAQPGPAN